MSCIFVVISVLRPPRRGTYLAILKVKTEPIPYNEQINATNKMKLIAATTALSTLAAARGRHLRGRTADRREVGCLAWTAWGIEQVSFGLRAGADPLGEADVAILPLPGDRFEEGRHRFWGERDDLEAAPKDLTAMGFLAPCADAARAAQGLDDNDAVLIEFAKNKLVDWGGEEEQGWELDDSSGADKDNDDEDEDETDDENDENGTSDDDTENNDQDGDNQVDGHDDDDDANDDEEDEFDEDDANDDYDYDDTIDNDDDEYDKDSEDDQSDGDNEHGEEDDYKDGDSNNDDEDDDDEVNNYDNDDDANDGDKDDYDEDSANEDYEYDDTSDDGDDGNDDDDTSDDGDDGNDDYEEHGEDKRTRGRF